MNPRSQKLVWVTSRDDMIVSHNENVKEDREGETLLEQTPELQNQITSSISSEELAKQEECLKSWEILQTEVRDVHQLFEDFSLMVQVR